jgi:hypothetical protein
LTAGRAFAWREKLHGQGQEVEKQIWDIEGFDVVIRHKDGSDVQGAKTGLPLCNQFGKAAKNDWTVADWRAGRFSPRYREFDVTVLDGDGNEVHGLTKLGNVRDTYSEE